MSTRSRGRYVENIARDLMLERGWIYHKQAFDPFGDKDIFNLYDFLFVKQGHLRFVQIKSNMSDFYTARKKIAMWCEENKVYFGTVTCEVWCYLGRRKTNWRSEVYKDGGWIETPI